MEKQITKLSSDELLEVSGGRENYVKRSWAKKFEPVDLETGEKDKEHDELKKKDSEISVDLKRTDDEEDE